MTITTLTRRELNQDVACAKRAGKSSPVFIRDSIAGQGVRRSPLAEARGQLLLTESASIASTWLREREVGVVALLVWPSGTSDRWVGGRASPMKLNEEKKAHDRTRRTFH